MCLAIPAKVIELLPDEMARVSLDGVCVIVSIALVQNLTPGDYVIVHVGYALAKLDEKEAQETLALFKQAAELSPPI